MGHYTAQPTSTDHALYPDGRQIPNIGDRVYQMVRGFGGSPACIIGEVYGKPGKLRVRVIESRSLLGGSASSKTYALNEYWTVDADPEIARRNQAKKEAEAKRKAEAEQEERERLATIKQAHDTFGFIEAGSLKLGEVIRCATSGRMATVKELDEHGDAYVVYQDEPEESTPGYTGHLHFWTRP